MLGSGDRTITNSLILNKKKDKKGFKEHSMIPHRHDHPRRHLCPKSYEPTLAGTLTTSRAMPTSLPNIPARFLLAESWLDIKVKANSDLGLEATQFRSGLHNEPNLATSESPDLCWFKH